MNVTPQPSENRSSDPFGSTRWSLVVAATGEGTQARAALEKLCEVYWFPVYGFVRSRTSNVDEAADRTQSFFADLLERKSIAAADRTRGQFRAFLLAALKNFLVNQHQRDTALKRGGGRVVTSLDVDVAETRLASSPRGAMTPDQEFERRWALAMLDEVLCRLANEQERAGRATEFNALRPFLAGSPEKTSLIDVARDLGITPEAARSALSRLRKRYRVILREEVAQTVVAPNTTDEELQRLIAAIGS